MLQFPEQNRLQTGVNDLGQMGVDGGFIPKGYTTEKGDLSVIKNHVRAGLAGSASAIALSLFICPSSFFCIQNYAFSVVYCPSSVDTRVGIRGDSIPFDQSVVALSQCSRHALCRVEPLYKVRKIRSLTGNRKYGTHQIYR